MYRKYVKTWLSEHIAGVYTCMHSLNEQVLEKKATQIEDKSLLDVLEQCRRLLAKHYNYWLLV
jgi:predicted glycosyl hydrolase (DUF1957 family)